MLPGGRVVPLVVGGFYGVPNNRPNHGRMLEVVLFVLQGRELKQTIFFWLRCAESVGFSKDFSWRQIKNDQHGFDGKLASVGFYD